MKSCYSCRLGLVLLVVLLLLATFPITGFAQSPHLVVNTHRLNVRSGPGVGHHIITSVPGGTELPVTAIDSGGLWYQVDSPLASGWVNSSYTIPRGAFSGIPRIGRPTDQPTVAPGTPHLVVNTGYLNVRSGPGIGHSIIMTVAGGAELPVISIGSDNLWYQVNSPAGPGWVNSYYTVTRGSFASLRQPRPLDNPATPTLSGPTPRAVVNTHRLNIRTGPGANYDIITSVPGGSHLAVLGLSRGRGWYLVEGSFGQGWLNNDFVVFRGDFSRVSVVQ
ncbi:MAG: SH3 domain-containing protein [Chloroflexota bacterium]|nr:SH3 domain-containing protein [Chloroflexota bacterium]